MPTPSRRLTLAHFQQLKTQGTSPFLCLTAADATMAQLLEAAGVPMLLVGDSLGMTVLGYESTTLVTLADMLHHTRAVVRGSHNALVVADMPFMSYHLSEADALANARTLLQEGGAGAVKLEGADPFVLGVIKRLAWAGVPVVGHVGLTPQQGQRQGGFKLQAKTQASAQQLLADALALQAAGAQLLVLELIPQELAAEVTKALHIPTLGIGAGKHCNGQVLVTDDVLGRYQGFKPKFVRTLAHQATEAQQAVSHLLTLVANGDFPAEAESFSVPALTLRNSKSI